MFCKVTMENLMKALVSPHQNLAQIDILPLGENIVDLGHIGQDEYFVSGGTDCHRATGSIEVVGKSYWVPYEGEHGNRRPPGGSFHCKVVVKGTAAFHRFNVVGDGGWTGIVYATEDVFPQIKDLLEKERQRRDT